MGWSIDDAPDLQESIDRFLEAETNRLTGSDATGALLREAAQRVSSYVGEPVIVSFTSHAGRMKFAGYPLSAITGGAAMKVAAAMKAAIATPAAPAVPPATCACYTCGKPTSKPANGAAPRCGKCG